MSQHKRIKLHPEADALVSFWIQERGDARLPSKKVSMNGTNLRRWLGDLSVVELHDGPKRYFVTLHGGGTQDRIGNTMTRSYFEDTLDGKSLDFALTPYRASEESRKPTYSVFVPRLYPGVFSRLERLVLPFCAENSGEENPKVSHFLVWAGPTGRSEVDQGSVYETISSAPASAKIFADAVELEILSV